MKIALQVIGWVLITVQALVYVGTTQTGLNPLLLPFVGFISFNIMGIIGVSLVFASKHVK